MLQKSFTIPPFPCFHRNTFLLRSFPFTSATPQLAVHAEKSRCSAESGTIFCVVYVLRPRAWQNVLRYFHHPTIVQSEKVRVAHAHTLKRMNHQPPFPFCHFAILTMLNSRKQGFMGVKHKMIAPTYTYSTRQKKVNKSNVTYVTLLECNLSETFPYSDRNFSVTLPSLCRTFCRACLSVHYVHT